MVHLCAARKGDLGILVDCGIHGFLNPPTPYRGKYTKVSKRNCCAASVAEQKRIFGFITELS